MEHIQPARYRVWGWPAVANFVMGGMASGFYMLGFLYAPLWKGGAFNGPRADMFSLLPPLLIVLGLLLITFEAGRPLRGMYILGNLRSSWMSREVLFAILFVLSASINWIFPRPILYLLSVALVICYLMSQGYMVYRGRALAAWNVPLAPVLFLTSGLVSGCGLLLIVMSLSRLAISVQLLVTGLVCLVVNLLIYVLYAVLPLRSFDFREATADLRRPVSLMLILGMGHLVPAFLLVMLLPTVGLSGMLSSHFQYLLLILAGLAIVGGGTFQKVLIILRGNSARSITMGQPQNRHCG